MSDTNRVETHFKGTDEAPELDNYRPISPVVIGACIAGLFSLLAVFHPLLWIVPVATVILSVYAIIRVSSAHSRYGGRGAAFVPLCLAVLVGAYAPARTISRDRMLFAEAREKSDQWLSLLQQGRAQEAHQLSMKSDVRFQGPGSLASHYVDAPSTEPLFSPEDEAAQMRGGAPSPGQLLGEFVNGRVIDKLLLFGEQSRLEHLRDVEMHYEYGDLKITLQYRLSGVYDGQPESTVFLIRATRHEVEQLGRWHVGELEPVN